MRTRIKIPLIVALLIILSGCFQRDPMSDLMDIAEKAGMNCFPQFCTDLGNEGVGLNIGGVITINEEEKEYIYSYASSDLSDFTTITANLDTGRATIVLNGKTLLNYDYINYIVISGDARYVEVFWESISVLEFLMDFYDGSYTLVGIFDYYNS
jgi:hypothetical protein